MNNAGLPGTGLGGLFYLLLALCMPLVEAYRTLRGRSEPGRWRQALAQFALACGVLATIVVTAWGYLRLVDAPRPFGAGGATLMLAPVVLAATLLAVLVVLLRVWARLVEPSPAPHQAPHAPTPAAR